MSQIVKQCNMTVKQMWHELRASVHFEELETFRQEPEKMFTVMIEADYQQSKTFGRAWITDRRLNV